MRPSFLRRAAPVLAALALLAFSPAPSRAQFPISLGDFTAPIVETFEGVVAPPNPNISGYSVPATGYTFASGLILSLPSPNPPSGAGFIVGDYAQGGGFGYGLNENGNIRSPADLHSGTAFGATGSGSSAVVGFTFPIPVNLVGLYASTVRSAGVESPLTFTLFDPRGALIGSFTFTDTQPLPLIDANFLGVGSLVPIGSFTVSVPAGFNSSFVFDDVTFQAAGPAALINDLIATVSGLDLPKGIKNSFVVKLEAALSALEAGDTASACDSLQAFINHARAQRGKKLTVQQATALIGAATEIRAELGCS